ncbi:MAG: condensation domain-containing protein, partial [Desulfatibacillaceae bacterium]|nr:condensation domain-containing protein [Desulfatibacillaceae bacterium]
MNLQVIRPLGDEEYLYWLLDFVSRTNFVFSAHIRGGLLQKHLAFACKALQGRHPLLNAAILPDKEHGAIFVKTAEPVGISTLSLAPFSSRFSGPEHPLVAALEKEHTTRFDTQKGPLLRLTLADHGNSEKTLVFCFHHSISDAVSAVGVIRDTLAACARIMEGKQPDFIEEPDAGPLERRIPKEHRGMGGFCGMAGHSTWQNIHRLAMRPVHVPVQTSCWPDERSDRLILTKFDQDETARLLQSVQKHNLTVHPALVGAKLKALAEEFPDKKRPRIWQLSLVNLRDRFEDAVSPDALNLMISMAETCHKVNRDIPYWNFCAEIKEKLAKKIEKGFHFYYLPWQVRLLRWARFARKDDENGARSLVRQGQVLRPFVAPVSNIGRVDIACDYGSFSLTGLHFGMAISTSGLLGSAAMTFDERLYWNFTYSAPT